MKKQGYARNQIVGGISHPGLESGGCTQSLLFGLTELEADF